MTEDDKPISPFTVFIVWPALGIAGWVIVLALAKFVYDVIR